MILFKFQKLKKEASPLLSQGKIGIMPTDTLYGFVGQALVPEAVERIYAARRRNPEKPCIILISSMKDLDLFGIRLSSVQRDKLREVWPGKVSVILDCEQKEFRYLHRGTNSLAFRLPKPKWLRRLLLITGPLIAPSANPEGEKPALTIAEAKEYFKDKADFYADFGALSSSPSTVIKLEYDGSVSILR